jgi:hypothetical protein
MAEHITYYAIIDYRATLQDPAGIVRRRISEDEIFDEALNKDFTWEFTPLIVEWERAESTPDLVEVSKGNADRIIARFRERWGTPG